MNADTTVRGINIPEEEIRALAKEINNSPNFDQDYQIIERFLDKYLIGVGVTDQERERYTNILHFELALDVVYKGHASAHTINHVLALITTPVGKVVIV